MWISQQDKEDHNPQPNATSMFSSNVSNFYRRSTSRIYIEIKVNKRDINLQVLSNDYSVKLNDLDLLFFTELADTMKYGGGLLYNLVFTE